MAKGKIKQKPISPRPGIAERIDALPKETLAAMVKKIVAALYWDRESGKYQPDLEWDSGTIENVAEVVINQGLLPKCSKKG